MHIQTENQSIQYRTAHRYLGEYLKVTPEYRLPANTEGEKERKSKTKVVSSQRVIFYGILCGFVKCGSGLVSTILLLVPTALLIQSESNFPPTLASCIASLTCATQQSPGR
jgi:hypothetical protein